MQADHALHAYKPLLPAVKTGQPQSDSIMFLLLEGKYRDIFRNLQVFSHNPSIIFHIIGSQRLRASPPYRLRFESLLKKGPEHYKKARDLFLKSSRAFWKNIGIIFSITPMLFLLLISPSFVRLEWRQSKTPIS